MTKRSRELLTLAIGGSAILSLALCACSPSSTLPSFETTATATTSELQSKSTEVVSAIFKKMKLSAKDEIELQQEYQNQKNVKNFDPNSGILLMNMSASSLYENTGWLISAKEFIGFANLTVSNASGVGLPIDTYLLAVMQDKPWAIDAYDLSNPLTTLVGPGVERNTIYVRDYQAWVSKNSVSDQVANFAKMLYVEGYSGSPVTCLAKAYDEVAKASNMTAVQYQAAQAKSGGDVAYPNPGSIRPTPEPSERQLIDRFESSVYRVGDKVHKIFDSGYAPTYSSELLEKYQSLTAKAATLLNGRQIPYSTEIAGGKAYGLLTLQVEPITRVFEYDGHTAIEQRFVDGPTLSAKSSWSFDLESLSVELQNSLGTKAVRLNPMNIKVVNGTTLVVTDICDYVLDLAREPY